MEGGYFSKLNGISTHFIKHSDHDHMIDTTMEEVCENICGVQSSITSPTRQSFGSYCDESKVDYDLQHLALEEVRDINKLNDEGDNDNNVEKFDMTLIPKDIEKLVGEKNLNKPKKLQIGNGDSSSANVELGRFLLSEAKHMVRCGDNTRKSLDLSLRASKLFEASANNGKQCCLDWIMCLHVIASIYCKLKEYNEAISVLRRSVEILVIEEGEKHALAKFVGLMQLGDTYAMVGELEKSILCYTKGLKTQKKVLGENDQRVGETCRYLAEALIQALRFDEAEQVCKMAISIHEESGLAVEAVDRRLMGLICEIKGDPGNALDHLVIASLEDSGELAFLDTSIGDFDEAICAYQKSLRALKITKGENHPATCSVYIRLADIYNRTGKVRNAKSCCENVLGIYDSHNPTISPLHIASGLTEISMIYESLNETEQAINLLQKALKIYADSPSHEIMIPGIEAQIGVLYYMIGKYIESYNTFKNVVSNLPTNGKKQSTIFGIALNHMGLACIHLDAIQEAVELFEEAKFIFEQKFGLYHRETFGVYRNLAGVYDATGRLDDAIALLRHVVGAPEEKHETKDDRKRLVQLLKEVGKSTQTNTKSLKSSFPDLVSKALFQ